MEEIVSSYGCNLSTFREHYRGVVSEAIVKREVQRQAQWTEGIAVGSEAFVKSIAAEMDRRVDLKIQEVANGGWIVREASAAYG